MPLGRVMVSTSGIATAWIGGGTGALPDGGGSGLGARAGARVAGGGGGRRGPSTMAAVRASALERRRSWVAWRWAPEAAAPVRPRSRQPAASELTVWSLPALPGARGGGSARRRRESHRAVLRHETTARHSLDIFGRHLVQVVDLGEQLTPVPVIAVIRRQQGCQAGVAIQPANHRRASLGFHALQGLRVDFLGPKARQQILQRLLVFLHRVPHRGSDEDDEQVRIA